MPGIPKIDPFYAPYCARPKGRLLLSTRSKQSPQPKLDDQESSPQEKSPIIYDSDDCVRFLTKNRCFVIPKNSSEPTGARRLACRTLLKGDWGGNPPTGTVFDEDKVLQTVRWLCSKPENAIIRAIGELVVPSINNSARLDTLAGSMDEPWNDLIPLVEGVPPLQRHADLVEERKYYLPRPQPDCSVGFSSLAFTDEQLLKLEPFLGGMNSTSFFRPTAEILFPFMVSEVKSKTTALHVAEYQSMHSMALCLRGTIYLFRLVKREQELDRMILGFSIVHNSSDVRIYGYYPVIDGPKISYHTHEISSFRLNSETRWNSYNFTMAIYHKWAPLHLDRIRSAVDQLPESIRIAAPAQSQSAGDSSTSRPSLDLAGSAEWSPSRRGSATVSSSYESPGLNTTDGSRQKRKR
ncbi:uncharacterized protein BJX67DRAFT_129633 [Aspergillus lucknowensis]|uniref:DUF7924 domain-containing protein n=1 Tax=Aspergillus lucknowensis TaxID=176173 RepID=A0ABR4LPQ1_9EURO